MRQSVVLSQSDLQELNKLNPEMAKETFGQRLFRNILQQGRIPKHIAFVLDGNRRFARERNMETKEGHKIGYDKIEEAITWSVLCGVKELTVYVFSIKNFDRTPEEVSGLMDLLKENIKKILTNVEDMENGRARYQFIGEWSLFPEDVVPLISKLMVATQINTQITVNIAFVYTGRNEITSGVNALVTAMANKSIDFQNVNETLLDQALQLYPMSPVDLFVRTGECRLSDFLTWGSNDHAVLCFKNQYWPSFLYWNYLASIFYYQSALFRIPSSAVNKIENCPLENEVLENGKRIIWGKIVSNIENPYNYGTQ